ncbi:MAG: helix-turn-helix domain-containing protein [Bacillota bacterium]
MFKEHIKSLRLRMGISQSELARRAGYSHEFISQVERGIKTPSIKALQKIAIGLGVSPSILMESNNTPRETEEKLKSEVQLLINNLSVEKLKILRDLLIVFPGQQDDSLVSQKHKVFK